MFLCGVLSKDYLNANTSKMNATGRKNVWDSGKARLNIVVNKLCGMLSPLLDQVNLSGKCLKLMCFQFISSNRALAFKEYTDKSPSL